jgi:hypothetical protein
MDVKALAKIIVREELDYNTIYDACLKFNQETIQKYDFIRMILGSSNKKVLEDVKAEILRLAKYENFHLDKRIYNVIYSYLAGNIRVTKSNRMPEHELKYMLCDLTGLDREVISATLVVDGKINDCY